MKYSFQCKVGEAADVSLHATLRLRFVEIRWLKSFSRQSFKVFFCIWCHLLLLCIEMTVLCSSIVKVTKIFKSIFYNNFECYIVLSHMKQRYLRNFKSANISQEIPVWKIKGLKI